MSLRSSRGGTLIHPMLIIKLFVSDKKGSFICVSCRYFRNDNIILDEVHHVSSVAAQHIRNFERD